MSNNQYNNFKYGIKNDLKGVGINLFAGVGLYLLVMVIVAVFMWSFYKENGYSIETKTIIGLALLAFVIAMFTNRRFGNMVYICWLYILLGILFLLCLGVLGLCLYAMRLIFSDFF